MGKPEMSGAISPAELLLSSGGDAGVRLAALRELLGLAGQCRKSSGPDGKTPEASPGEDSGKLPGARVFRSCCG